jgi:hypothetical protein
LVFGHLWIRREWPSCFCLQICQFSCAILFQAELFAFALLCSPLLLLQPGKKPLFINQQLLPDTDYCHVQTIRLAVKQQPSQPPGVNAGSADKTEELC